MNASPLGNNENSVKYNALGIPKGYDKRADRLKPLSGNFTWHVFKKGMVCSGKAAAWIGPNIILSLLAINTLIEPYKILLKRKKHSEM